ncbi:MAG: SRPBCC domain-containing protein [Gammaproteobacteria bacterium]|nr:SRPBCC domain-containing protein [Gammaproteobacteria bacterium]MBP7910041.1 SRPBCC domain-containing protein [Pseudomonadales bacterium]
MQPDDIRTAYDPANVVRSITIEIDAPAAIVWEVLTDLPDYNHWNPMCVRAESTLELGAPIRMKLVNYANPGTLIPVVEYVCAVEPQRLLSWEAPWLAEWPYPARRDQVIEALGHDRCRYYSTDAFLGETGIHVMRFAGPWVKRGFDDTALALKVRAEEVYAERSRGALR